MGLSSFLFGLDVYVEFQRLNVFLAQIVQDVLLRFYGFLRDVGMVTLDVKHSDIIADKWLFKPNGTVEVIVAVYVLLLTYSSFL